MGRGRPTSGPTALLADDRLTFCRHYLASARRYRPHLLSEPEERILADKSLTANSAWVRLFSELTSAITVDLDGALGEPRAGTLAAHVARPRGAARRGRRGHRGTGARAAHARVRVQHAARRQVDRRPAAAATRSWIASRNLANEASDESVQALVDAVQARYDIPQRWYALKAQLLGLPKLADYDRMASVASARRGVRLERGPRLVLDAYASFSPELASAAERFFDESWIDAPIRPGKRPGAFCAYTVPSQHPYLLLNWTARRRDVLTLAHEMGHGLHAYLAREQGIFHQTTPLTLAETASVFGETVTFGRLLDATDDPAARLALLAESLEGQIATVFRQVAMNRFEDRVHTQRRDEGELSIEQFNEAWDDDPGGDARRHRRDHRGLPHLVVVHPALHGHPGYVYAYSYGQLLALSVYRAYEERGDEFVPKYLELLAAGGSRSPEELGAIVGLDLADPGFWSGGLAIVAEQLEAAEAAARESGRL